VILIIRDPRGGKLILLINKLFIAAQESNITALVISGHTSDFSHGYCSSLCCLVTTHIPNLIQM
jgi:hypothetical protein